MTRWVVGGLFLSVVLAGCSSAVNRISGSWSASDGNYTFRFLPNGKFERAWHNVDPSNKSRDWGQWKRDGQQLLITVEGRQIDPRFQPSRLRPLPYTIKRDITEMTDSDLVLVDELKAKHILTRSREQ